MKRHYATALLATLALAAFGLVSPGSAANAAGPVVSVSIADSAASYITRPLALDPGTQIPAALIPLRIADAEGVAEEITAADPRVSLSTSNAAVVAISDGQLQVLSNGYATVTATVEAASTDLLIWGSGPDKTYLFDDFESTAIGELPSYFNHTRGTVRPSVVETDQGGHQLLLNNPTQEFTTLLVPLPAGIGDYTIEADLTWLNVRDNARWSSLMYRVQGLDRPYYQMAVRQNSTASNGVEFAYRTSSNAWDVRSTQAAPTTQALNTQHHYKVEVNANRVREYFDGQLMIYSDMVTEHATGNVGIQTNYGTAQWDNLRISLMTDPIPAPQTSTAEPKTLSPNLVNPPTVVANQAADLAQVTALSDDDVTTSLLADLSLAEGKLVVSSQGNHLGELLEVLAAAPQLVQVVLRIEDQPTAQAFIATVNDGLEDQHVTSSDPNITKLIRQATTAHPVRASLLTNQTPTTVAEGLDLVKQANIGWTKNIILTGSIPSKTVIEQMQRRLASVWVTATDSLLSATQAITSGANGIVTSTPATVQSAAAVFTTPTLTRRPFVIAHRGTPGAAPYGGAAPENTMLSYRKSVEDFGADMIETDIYVTKDDAVILLHDDTFARTTDIQTTTALTDAEVAATGRTRAQLRPIDLTLEQIKRLNAGQGEPIPTLDELLDYMVGKDVVLFLESKDLISDDIERRCVEVLNAHPAVKDQVTIISFNERSLSRYTELAPEMSLGFLIGESLSTNPQAAMATILGHTQKFNATYNPSSGPINNTIVKHLSARGITIWPWTINSASGWANFINMGVGGITTDLSGYAKDSAFVIQPNLAANHLEIGQSTDLAVTATTHIGGQLDLASEALVIDGGEHIAIANNQITGVSRGVAHLLLRAQHPAGSGGAYTSYALYTEPITVTVGDNSNSVLGLAVETYGKVIQRRADYTPSSFAAFQLAYDRAVALLERGDFSTAEQSAAIAELQQAFAGLELAPALGPLQALIAHAEAILEHPEGFMQSSLADLRTALTAAQTALANPALTNLEALSTALALQQAIAAVTAKGDTSALLALVDLVDRLVASAFTPATWNPVQTARQAAQPVIDLAEASELAVQLAYDRLYQAVSDLALRANHSGLTSAITIAQLILADQTAYLPSSIVGLAEALTHAETVNADGNATQAEVDAAQQALLELVVKARLRPTGTSPIVANGQGLTQTVSKVSAVIKTNLSAKAKPQIVGQAKVGTRLRAKTTWSAGQTVKTSYRWYRNGKAIRGAVAQSYRLGQADKGKRITVRVTGRAPNGAKVTVASRASSKVRG